MLKGSVSYTHTRKGNQLLGELRYTQIHTSMCPTTSLCIPCRALTQGCGRGLGRAPPPALGRAPPSPQRTPPAAPARAAPALPLLVPPGAAPGAHWPAPLQGAARGGAAEQSVIGRRRTPTFPPVTRAAPPGCEGGRL